MDKIFKGITSITFNGFKINKEKLDELERIYEQQINSQKIINKEYILELINTHGKNLKENL